MICCPDDAVVVRRESGLAARSTGQTTTSGRVWLSVHCRGTPTEGSTAEAELDFFGKLVS